MEIKNKCGVFKVVLVYPGARAPPYGLMAIAGMLEKHGFDVKIADFTDEPITTQNVLAKMPFVPNLIGVTSYSTPMISRAIEITKIVKNSYPQSFTIWGGVHATLFPVQTLNELDIDAVCVGEGDYVMLEIANNLKQDSGFEEMKKINGLYLKGENNEVIYTGTRPSIENLDGLPLYPWHLLDMEKYVWTNPLTKRKGIIIVSSRGCPYRCNFCYTYTMYGGTWRGISVESLLKELSHLHNHYGITNVWLADDLPFGGNKNGMRKFCEQIKDTGIETWNLNYRTNLVDRTLLETMNNAGCEEIYFGIESGSPRMLNIMDKKNLTVENITNAFDLCYEIGIRTYAGFIIGFPGETADDLNNTVSLARRIPATMYRAANYVPYAGTKMGEMARSYGFHEPTNMIDWAVKGSYEKSVSNFSLVNDKELAKIKRDIERLNYIKPLQFAFKHKKFIGILPIFAETVSRPFKESVIHKYFMTFLGSIAKIYSFIFVKKHENKK